MIRNKIWLSDQIGNHNSDLDFWNCFQDILTVCSLKDTKTMHIKNESTTNDRQIYPINFTTISQTLFCKKENKCI